VIGEEGEQQEWKYRVFAKINAVYQVERIYSTCFEQSEGSDVFIKDGDGDECVHVGYYQIYDQEGLHNYKIDGNVMVETTAEEKAVELAARPKPEPTTEEQILQLQAVVIDM